MGKLAALTWLARQTPRHFRGGGVAVGLTFVLLLSPAGGLDPARMPADPAVPFTHV
jgi:hypothetical protein